MRIDKDEKICISITGIDFPGNGWHNNEIHLEYNTIISIERENLSKRRCAVHDLPGLQVDQRLGNG
jgi:hypothetical protein